MKKIYLLLIVVVLSFTTNLKAQNYPQDFVQPLKIPYSLAGTFGELRSNHYHSGIDIRTQQREGFNIHSVQSGYVSRIKISSRGYGLALYIRHPNGYTSVYAHLKSYKGKIAEYVRKQQYKHKKFELDLFPTTNLLKVQKDEVVALSGNSGSSGGPHLHFEIRDTRTEHPMNPYLFGILAKDTKKPLIKGVYLYPYGGIVKGFAKSKQVVLFPKNSLHATKSINVSGKVGVGIHTEDRHDLSGFRLGVYTIDMYVNDELTYAYKMDRFSFAETRYLNAHTDYEHKYTKGSWIHRLFVLPGDKNSTLYKTKVNNGFIETEPGKTYNIKIVSKDFFGNTKTTSFKLNGIEYKPQTEIKAPNKKYFAWETKNQFINPNIKLNFPSGSFYEDFHFEYKYEKGWHKVHKATVPVQKRFTIELKADRIPANKLNKALIVEKTKKGGIASIGGTYYGGFVKAKTRTLGSYKVSFDDVAPRIVSLNTKNGAKKSNKSTIRIKGTDNLSGIKSYSGTIDGKWVLMMYDKKSKTFTFRFKNEAISKGNHIFEFKLVDNKGNKAFKKINFVKI